ncbi:riboflavin biosynthesis protein RibF [Niastella yeongjuensis]|uniref:Riboflavin biosynthesis protein n=1 Tax=Niastella yeongjuensis TaxID=354355 RepID=A0A1V9F8L1_9BACT|nr:bifunctional riboflavin kinase/FAD synthetase [Niastella yeongjuensis]OQP54602.1 riboflavin biosynthesis protein RibF [Niastella yeongjuensis]SEO00477.1 riboflavin kinase / FMN adenylyltransferase [Niastella yeongjuensis]
MKVYFSIDTIPAFTKAVVTIGTFDGVHTGHKTILEQLKREAARIGGETVIITFHPHPRKVIVSGQPGIQLINTIDEKIELLDKNGIDHLVVVPFTDAFAKQTPEEYIQQFLVEKFHPHTVIIGYDHRFGKDRKGDYKLLETYSQRLGFNLLEIPAHLINDNTVSSTRIREALLQGNTDVANTLLGYDFFFEGTVVDGNKLGRTLGYPTANLRIENEEKIIPGNGIYAVQAEIMEGQKAAGSGQREEGNREWAMGNGEKAEGSRQWAVGKSQTILNGMMSIGVRPTIGGTDRVIEVNLFDFNQDIYGKTLRVYIKKYLRSEVKFNGLEALVEQLAKDKEDTLKVLGLTS